ncbi:MAG: hypothetical protein AAF623_04165 [Planctomycetota bacterium]
MSLPEMEPSQGKQQVLTEIRSGRRLEKIASSIGSFLDNQLERLEAAFKEIERVAANDRIVQNILAEFELEKREWEMERQAEIDRLNRAGEELIEAWQKLESEKKAWMDEREKP